MGGSFGASGYLGEIGGRNNVSKGFVGDLLLKQTSITAGWFVRNKLTPKLSINSGLNYIRLNGDDSNTPEGPRNWRNLRFKNDIFELTSKAEFIFLEIADLGGKRKAIPIALLPHRFYLVLPPQWEVLTVIIG